jgi:phosphocarrier protein
MERTVRLANQNGLHVRPAAEFVKVATRFRAEVRVEKDGLEVNGKSIMGVMMLAAEYGSTLVVRAEGSDEHAALEALVELLTTPFEEL